MAKLTLYQVRFANHPFHLLAQNEKELIKLLQWCGPIRDYIVEIVFLEWDSDATFCQDDYEYLTHTGRYAYIPY